MEKYYKSVYITQIHILGQFSKIWINIYISPTSHTHWWT